MKKQTLILLLFGYFFYSPIFSQNVFIPDSLFKAMLIADKRINLNGDTAIQFSEAISTKSILAQGSELGFPMGGSTSPLKVIKNLQGIEAFLNLDSLDCRANQIENLDLSKNTKLTYLDCSGSYSGYFSAYVRVNVLSLDISKNINLKYLNVGGNGLKSLNIFQNIKLSHIEFGGNFFLKNIDLSKNENLEYLNCVQMGLDSINISKNIKLKKFDGYTNNLVSVDFSKNLQLETVYINSNRLKNLNLINNKALSQLSCFNNPDLKMVCIPDISKVSKFKGGGVEWSESCDITGIHANIFNSNLMMYPNPTNDFVNFKGEILSIQIYNQSGNLILEGNKNIVDVKNLSNGLYFAKIIYFNHKLSTLKFLKY